MKKSFYIKHIVLIEWFLNKVYYYHYYYYLSVE